MTISFPPGPDTLFLCDIENLAGAASPTVGDVRRIDSLIHRAFGVRLLEVLACDAHNAEVVWFNWTHDARRLIGHGPDGADLELMGVLRHEGVEQRFRRVIIGSGDHIFAEPAMRLTAAGVQVVAAVGRGYCATRLRQAVKDVVHLPLPSSPRRSGQAPATAPRTRAAPEMGSAGQLTARSRPSQ